LPLFSFGVYGLALAALAVVVFGAYDSYPIWIIRVKHQWNGIVDSYQLKWLLIGVS